MDNKNMILAVVLSLGIMLAFDFYSKWKYPPPTPEQIAQQQAQVAAQGGDASASAGAPAGSVPAISGDAPSIPGAQVPGAAPAASKEATRAEILKASKRVVINTPRLHGSIALKGGRLDDITLADYYETIEPDSAEITLFSPRGAENAYFADFGWVASKGVAVPTSETEWTANGDTLTPQSPVTLTWDNGQGLVFSRTFAVDANFLFTVTQRVRNNSGQPVNLRPYGLVSRRGTPETTGFYILHEGLLGVADGTLSEIDYDDLQEGPAVKQSSTGGWIGITDKYWLAALIPDQKTKVDTRYLYNKTGVIEKYQVDFLTPGGTAPAGGSFETTSRLFAGAKEVNLLDAYEAEFGIDRFDLTIDWGWFHFLTKPIFYGLLWINDIILNLGLAILLLTVAIKLIFFPLANKSYTSMSKMKKLQPEITKMRERFGEDKMKLNQEMMALYKKEKVNPASGCLPILVQIPVFFALYKVLFVTIEMRHAPFYGWIKDLSAQDPTSLFNLFGLLPFTPPDFLMIGAWPVIMGVTMFLQQKLNPQPADPIQAKIFLFLPLIFTFLLATFPAGLVIYWAWNNLLSMGQQWLIMRRMGISGKDALK